MTAPEDDVVQAAGEGVHVADRTPQADAPCGCDEAVERLWEYVDSELGELDQVRIEAHLHECAPCLEEEQLELVMKQLVRRCCQERAPETLRLRIHEQLSVLRLRPGATPEA